MRPISPREKDISLSANKDMNATDRIDIQALLEESHINEVLDALDKDLVGLVPVKQRIREIAAYLLITKARLQLGIEAAKPSLHMCFTGNPGTGKTTVALKMAEMLHRLGYIRQNHVISVTRDDLVGQYIGHTAPKTKEVIKKAMGGVLFIDEAYYLYKPENERDYGQESIEILLQTMENHRDDLVVILAGYQDRMGTFFKSNPGLSSRIAHHIDFPDYNEDELLQITKLMSYAMHYNLDANASKAMQEYIQRRKQQPHFANARSIRNALDRARLRQANRLFNDAIQNKKQTTAADLSLITEADIRASRVFTDNKVADNKTG